MSELWAFLADRQTQATLTWLGGGLAVAAGGGWVVVKFFASRGDAPEPTSNHTRVEADRGGIAGGRDALVCTSHGLPGGTAVLLMLTVVGAVLLAGGLLGQRITATQGGIAIGGGVRDSTIEGGALEMKP